MKKIIIRTLASVTLLCLTLQNANAQTKASAPYPLSRVTLVTHSSPGGVVTCSCVT
jgi:hypothetical protein